MLVLKIAGIVIGFTIILMMLGGVHFINEGHIGVYTRGGALLNGYTEPGVHTMIPLITKVHQVQVTLQTDKVSNIPCGTSGGVMLTFDKIEVVNRLRKDLAWETIKNYTMDYDKTWIFNKIHHEINQFCSVHTLQEVYITKFDQLDDSLKNAIQQGCNDRAPGIEIIAVRVTKPKIPSSIKQNYEKTEAEKTKYLIAKETQLVSEKESETDKILDKMEAEIEAEISKITNTKDILIKNGTRRTQEIEDEINLEKQKTFANAHQYKYEKENEIYKTQLTPEYIKYTIMQNLKPIQKIYYGKNLVEFLEKNNIMRNFTPIVDLK